MIETNIRIVKPGTGLYIYARFARVSSQDNSPGLLQKACNALRGCGFPAFPAPSCENELLVATHEPVPSIVIEEEDWRADITDTGRFQYLRFTNPSEASIIAPLVERCLLIEIRRKNNYWTLDSPRILYQLKPIHDTGEFVAYRRFEVSAIPIEEQGIGIAVHVTTAFFTKQTLADFYRYDIPEERQRELHERFEWLSRRQQGQKATLLYDLGNSKHKCYFDKFLKNMTCATTDKLRVKGHDYRSLYEYYQIKHPNIVVNSDDPVALVSFPKLECPQLVVANRLYLRVMNDVLPSQLKQLDKIDPADRYPLIQGFWDELGAHPLGQGKPGISSNCWQPNRRYTFQIKPPDLQFANRFVLNAPNNGDILQHREYFYKRRTLINKYGCLKVPPSVTRVVQLAVPRYADKAMVTRLADDIETMLSTWTKKPITIPDPLKYDNLHQALSTLRQQTPGYVLFVFENHDPAAYDTVARELNEWRVKRITFCTLQNRFDLLKRGKKEKWQSFIEPSALDILQQMECVPWVISTPLHYEAQIAIDVGWDRRHFALSLLICRLHPVLPSFWLDTVVEVKAYPKCETINHIHLKDKLVALFQRAACRRRFDPLRSVLVLRDGRECGYELEAIETAKSELINLGLFITDVRVDAIDVHKKSMKGIRYWERNNNGYVRNVLEGKALFLDTKTVLIANTGAATLHQGTADPLMLVAHSGNVDMNAVASDVNATSHFNWSSPTVAQRLPLVLKRTQEQLEIRAAQEIRRIR